MLVLSLGSVLLAASLAGAAPTATNIKGDGGPVAELPQNWDRTKEDAQSLFLNKNDKNDLEPYPLALNEEGAEELQLEERGYDAPASELDNLMLPGLYAEGGEGAPDYASRRRKRGSGTKVGGAGAATKVATKAGSGKKTLKAAAPEPGRQKRDSGLSAADVRALLAMWEAQEQRRKAEWNSQWADYARGADQDDNGEFWYKEPVVVDPRERDFPHSYFSEQNRLALSRFPEAEPELSPRYDARRKRGYGGNIKRFMVARKRSPHQPLRPREDLYALADLLRSAPRVQDNRRFAF